MAKLQHKTLLFQTTYSRINVIGILIGFLLHIGCSLSQNISSNSSSNATLPASALQVNTTLILPLASTNISCDDNNSSSDSCRISDGFVCIDGMCNCAYPNLTYNKEKHVCMAKLNEQCGFFIGLENASTVACPDNAICGLVNLEVVTDGHNNQYSIHQCACVYTHHQNDNGECVPLAKHGETCSDQRKCSPDSGLICVNGSCQCQFKEDQFFDLETNKCISFAGGNCTQNCVPNAVCDFWQSGTCQCRLDHQINAQRKCEPIPPGYLLPCLGESEICNAEMGLKCIDKVCQCKNPLHQVFDYQQEKCIGLAGDICDPSVADNCVKNALCQVKKDSQLRSQHTCQCVEGFSTTPFRKCMKSHKAPCSNEFCNVYRGLACVNGTCECYDSFLKYDETLKACLSQPGGQCGKIFVPFPGDWIKSSCPECDSYYFACESKSVCSRDLSTEMGALEKFRCEPQPQPT